MCARSTSGRGGAPENRVVKHARVARRNTPETTKERMPAQLQKKKPGGQPNRLRETEVVRENGDRLTNNDSLQLTDLEANAELPARVH